tara:strand:+ start:4886 stop:5581 length:696 start_codon:yes stop_codon:yes gene_type:complete
MSNLTEQIANAFPKAVAIGDSDGSWTRLQDMISRSDNFAAKLSKVFNDSQSGDAQASKIIKMVTMDPDMISAFSVFAEKKTSARKKKDPWGATWVDAVSGALRADLEVTFKTSILANVRRAILSKGEPTALPNSGVPAAVAEAAALCEEYASADLMRLFLNSFGSHTHLRKSGIDIPATNVDGVIMHADKDGNAEIRNVALGWRNDCLRKPKKSAAPADKLPPASADAGEE